MFNKYSSYEDYGEYEEFSLDNDIIETNDDYEELGEADESVIGVVNILAVISTWFMKIGVVIAIILTIMFFVTGKINIAFLYIGGLIIAFFFGYFFMYFLDKFLTKSN